MKKKLLKGLVGIGGVALLTGGILLANVVNSLEETNDVTPPYGKIQIRGAVNQNGTNYISNTTYEVEVYAKDDLCKDEEIKYYISTSPITSAIDESLWKSYKSETVETFTFEDSETTNTLYAIFKDKAGNTSIIYSDNNTKCTITYDANGGTNAPEAQTTNIGMPIKLSATKPTYEGKYFMGWSEVKGTTGADYEGVTLLGQGATISANAFSNDKKDITLYAAWTEDINDLPKLSEKVRVGDYVNYPVHYDNVPTNGETNIASLNGWRVLSKNDDGTVNLVSAGVPLTYHNHFYPTNIQNNLLFKFLTTPFTPQNIGYFIKSGFNAYSSLEEAFENKYTAQYENDEEVLYKSIHNDGSEHEISGTIEKGTYKVRALRKEDLYHICDKTDENNFKSSELLTDAKYEKLIAVPTSDIEDAYVQYWLATPTAEARTAYIMNTGHINLTGGYQGERGIRVVVTLDKDVKTTGTDLTGAWNIEIAK